MNNVLNEIILENYRGVKKRRVVLNNCIPGKLQIIVGRNGCGKTTLFHVFESANSSKLECKLEDYYQRNINLKPSLKLKAHLNGDEKYLELNENGNTIKNYFRIETITTRYEATTKKVFAHGRSLSVGKIKSYEIQIIRKPIRNSISYSFSQFKESARRGSKFFNSLSNIVDKEDFVQFYKNHVYPILSNKRIRNIVNECLSFFDNIATETKKETLLEHLYDYECINNLIKNADYIKMSDYFYDQTKTEKEKIMEIIQIFTSNFNVSEIRQLVDYYEDTSAINGAMLILDSINTTGREIYGYEKGFFKVFVKDSEAVSNGERDLIILFGELLKLLNNRELNKPRLIILDGIFDYLDGANIIAFQYYINRFISNRFKNDFFIVLTHISPYYFKNFVLSSKINESYFDEEAENITEEFLSLVANRNENNASVNKYFFHYYPLDITSSGTKEEIEEANTFFERKVSNIDFYDELASEITKYKEFKQYDILKLFLALKIIAEKTMYDALTEEESQSRFLEAHGEDKYLVFQDNGEIPFFIQVLRPLYNEAMHFKLANKKAKINKCLLLLNNRIVDKIIKEDVEEEIIKGKDI